ncbi:MAG: hypothetical protein MI974_29975 [Chitinophagales bacterium]|nr:hypothetical protein [Chitinophagales bacterium]
MRTLIYIIGIFFLLTIGYCTLITINSDERELPKSIALEWNYNISNDSLSIIFQGGTTPYDFSLLKNDSLIIEQEFVETGEYYIDAFDGSSGEYEIRIIDVSHVNTEQYFSIRSKNEAVEKQEPDSIIQTLDTLLCWNFKTKDAMLNKLKNIYARFDGYRYKVGTSIKSNRDTIGLETQIRNGQGLFIDSLENTIQTRPSKRSDIRNTYFVREYFEHIYNNERYDHVKVEIDTASIYIINEFEFDTLQGIWKGKVSFNITYEGIEQWEVRKDIIEMEEKVVFVDGNLREGDVFIKPKNCRTGSSYVINGCCDIYLGDIITIE